VLLLLLQDRVCVKLHVLSCLCVPSGWLWPFLGFSGSCGTACVIASVCAVWVALAFFGFLFWAVGFELALGTEPDLLLGGRAGNRWSCVVLNLDRVGLTGSHPGEAFASCTAVLFSVFIISRAMYLAAPRRLGTAAAGSQQSSSSDP
jgi:hypothetical protein